MKKISIICTILSLTFIFLSCDKETNTLTKDDFNSQEYTIQQNNSKEDGFVYGGDNIYGEGWIGWIDPKLVEPSDTIEYENIIHGPANLLGIMQKIGQEILIDCKDPGHDCGELRWVRPFRKDKVVGFYILVEN
ncbi:MAG: hypothetical protein H6Q25_253 [Bacteroidetes bacterium]|nr:hypothetical protein [Bacteroidota bacterium]